MRTQKANPVSVKCGDARDLERRLDALKAETQRRAYYLYCRRGDQKGSALEDWSLAERPTQLAPLAGLTEDERDVRIVACVPGAKQCDLMVECLPNEIVLEANRNGEIERYTRFRLPGAVDTAKVTAQLRGSELEVVAPRVVGRAPAA